MIKNIKWLALVSLAFVACNNDDTTTVAEVPVTPGSANFSKYVALGDSFAAGYSDGALFKRGQTNAYPNILAAQFSQAGGGAFTSPLCGDDNKGGLLFSGTPIQGTRLYFDPIAQAPVPYPGSPVTEVLNHLTGPFNNLGVPGAKSYHLGAAGYGNAAGVPSGAANPYFARFATSGTTSVVADALVQQPTFFSLWIGGNDVLGYATSGGTGVNQTGNMNPATYGGSDITDPTVFNTVYNGLASQLSAGGRKGVVANLPYINTLPFFTTVPYNPATLSAGQASALNSGYAGYNAGLVGAKNAGFITETERVRRTINFVEGVNTVVITDEYLTNLSGLGLPSYRQTTAEDYIVLSSGGVSAKAFLSAGNGTQFPLPDKWVVSKNEVSELKTATDAYNVTIKAAADANGLAFVDAKAVMDQLTHGGIRYGNYHMSAEYVKGGAFSLDGVHPTARGYALIANKFIEAINAKYGATLRGAALESFPMSYPAVLP